MAMVRITNGETTSRVPYSAYISYFKNIGFVIEGEEPTSPKAKAPKETKEQSKVEEKVEEESEAADEVEDDYDDEEEDEEAADNEAFVEDILEKPISQWTQDELKKFAEIKNVDTSKAKKVSEARAIIKKYLEEQAKAQV